ncbi:hypothetical protein WS72_05715 [Burkholderia savannae]|uniref:Uncharacterized protein n=1 Tax=Burkholderia savannae TaxID=1637837 RepID=A0ABR5TBZ5_9BURK|nr:hypothetical protein WS72_05715 [Burkholderia savannae]
MRHAARGTRNAEREASAAGHAATRITHPSPFEPARRANAARAAAPNEAEAPRGGRRAIR